MYIYTHVCLYMFVVNRTKSLDLYASISHTHIVLPHFILSPEIENASPFIKLTF